MKQKTFADFIGVRYDTYQSLELGRGRTRLSPKLATRIDRSTGAILPFLNAPGAPVFDWKRRPYTERSWREYKAVGQAGKITVRGQVMKISGWVEVLLEAARREGKLSQASDFMADAISRARVVFGLQPETNRVLRERKVKLTETLCVAIPWSPMGCKAPPPAVAQDETRKVAPV
jgi:hypothetical protein